jgi:hypothetical protein
MSLDIKNFYLNTPMLRYEYVHIRIDNVPEEIIKIYKSRLDDYARYEAAEHGAAKFLRETVNEVWYNDLKDADTFYTKVTALEIMTFLDANSGGLHAINMISLRTNMHQYKAKTTVTSRLNNQASNPPCRGPRGAS